MNAAIGVRLGLYEAMAGAGPLTSEELAGLRTLRTRMACRPGGRTVRHYDAGSDTYVLPDEHAAVLADPTAPTYAVGRFLTLKALYGTEDALVEAFRTGKGVGWGQHGPELFEGVATFFRPGYAARLVSECLPALDGVVDKLKHGASVTDVGYSTLLMAQAFPESRFHGYDFHGPSIDRARRLAAEQGLSDRVSFDVATAQDFPGEEYDLITFFDCLHDLGDPGAALRRAEQALADDGTCMIVEPNVSANVLENINPLGRAATAASVALCLPTAMDQNGPHALGNHAGEEAIRKIAAEAGLHDWTLAMEAVTNRIYAAKR